MGTYGIQVEELLEPLEKFLKEQEGNVSAEVMAEAWNELGKKYGWKDKLIVDNSKLYAKE